MKNAGAVIIVMLAIAITVFLGTAIMDQLATATDTYEDIEEDVVLLDGTGQYTTITDEGGVAGTDETVVDSLGRAAYLDGNASFETTDDVDLAGGTNWTISVWTAINQSASGDKMAVVDINGQVVIYYDGNHSQWQAWYYKEDTADSYLVNVSAPSQPGTFSNLQVVTNDSHIQIYRNNTAGESVNITTGNHADANLSADDLHGSVDELRVFDTNLTSSKRQTLVDTPVAPVKNTNRTLRIMFDETNQDTQKAFFAPTDISTNGVEIESGLNGSDLVAGTDYEWRDQGPQIKPLKGGKIDGAPVAYADYERKGVASTMVSSWVDFAQMVMLIGLMAIITIIIARLKAM